MLVDVEFDQEVFVNGLVKASQTMSDMKYGLKPEGMVVPKTTFKHFKDTLYFQEMFENPPDWRKRLWNSKHNPINFDTPMFMGIPIEVVPDCEQDTCFLIADSQMDNVKIPFEYSLKLVREHTIKNNIRGVSIFVKKSRADEYSNVPKNEWCAIETLREMITEAEFRKYMKYGFITVRGKSGCTYQIFRNRSHTKVWVNGKVVEEICVRIEGKEVPPTDNVIAFKIMVETDEDAFKKLGNVYNMREAA